MLCPVVDFDEGLVTVTDTATDTGLAALRRRYGADGAGRVGARIDSALWNDVLAVQLWPRRTRWSLPNRSVSERCTSVRFEIIRPNWVPNWPCPTTVSLWSGW